MSTYKNYFRNGILLALVALLSACGSVMQAPPTAAELIAPEPREDSAGKFLSPYTSDGVVAGWVEKGIAAQAGSAVGSIVGQQAAQKLAENIPFASMFARQAGEAAGRAVAIKASGGWEAMRETTDLSFDTVDDMIVYTYVNFSTNEHYPDVVSHIGKIYPDWTKRFQAAISQAPRRVTN